MDLLLDNSLIDIKTTKYLELKRDYLNQLIGYYILFLIGGIDDGPSKTNIEFNVIDSINMLNFNSIFYKFSGLYITLTRPNLHFIELPTNVLDSVD